MEIYLIDKKKEPNWPLKLLANGGKTETTRKRSRRNLWIR